MKKISKKYLLPIVLIFSVLIFSGCGQKEKVYKVGILSGLDFFFPTVDGFKEKMTDLGYIEGKNIVYEINKTDFEPEKEKMILDKYVKEKVDLILTFPTEVSIAAKEATKATNIPVVFANAITENSSLINSIKEPGMNVTGVRYPGPDITVRRFKIMNQLYPRAKKIFIPYQKGYPIIFTEMEALRAVASPLGITVEEFAAENLDDFKNELIRRDKLEEPGMDAILFIVETLGTTSEAVKVTSDFSNKHKIPAFGTSRDIDKNDTIFGLSIDSIEVGKQAATLANRIFLGSSAGSLPVISAEGFLTINYRAAQKYGITIPENLLSQANNIIK